MNKNTNTVNHLKRFPSNASQKVQIDYLKDAVNQLSRQIITHETIIRRHTYLLNPEITTKRILELIKRNDERITDLTAYLKKHYFTQSEWEKFVRGETRIDGIWIGIWKFFAETLELNLRWDRNMTSSRNISDADFVEAGVPYESNAPEEP